MKKDLGKNDERTGSKGSTSKLLSRGQRVPRAEWSKSSKAIARNSDDHLILGEFPNLDDKFLEW